jgi:hypothetical protein
MTIQYILKYIKDGQAAKRPSMRGYVKRVDALVDDTGKVNKYALTFVTNAETDTGGSFSYTFTVGENGVVSVTLGDLNGANASPVVMDPQLLQHFMADDWEIGSYENYESVRSGNTGRW